LYDSIYLESDILPTGFECGVFNGKIQLKLTTKDPVEAARQYQAFMRASHP